jgi:type I site-specific restriction-modification system R (restriction) subunit
MDSAPVDFKHRENNSFIAVCQFKVRILGTDHHIIPDVVLFLNGLPVVVIECKSPKVSDAITSLERDNPLKLDVEQLKRLKSDVVISKRHNDELHPFRHKLCAANSLAACRARKDVLILW